MPPPKKNKMRWLRIAIPVVVVLLAIGFAVVKFVGSPESSNAGDCLAVTEFKQGVEPTKAGCEDPSANVKIAVKLDNDGDSCPDGDYDEFSVTGSSSYKLCLMINAKQGDCFADLTSKTAGYKKVSCTDPTVEGEVVKVADGKQDKELCGAVSAVPVTYSQPATTLCVKVK